LQLFYFPDELKDTGKLERTLLSQRILFQRVTIMPKCEFPKLKGAICNILPRGVDSSNVVFVQLKRKLSHKFPVITERVRKEKLDTFLRFLIENNFLYDHTWIDIPNLINNDTEKTIQLSDSIDFDISSSEVLDIHV